MKNYFDINGDINRQRNGSEYTGNQKNVSDGESITIDIPASSTYGVGQLIKVMESGNYRFSFSVDSIGNGSGVAGVVWDINNTSSSVARSVKETTGMLSFDVTLDSTKTYMFGWYVVGGTAPCGAQISDVIVADPEVLSNTELSNASMIFLGSISSGSLSSHTDNGWYYIPYGASFSFI